MVWKILMVFVAVATASSSGFVLSPHHSSAVRTVGTPQFSRDARAGSRRPLLPSPIAPPPSHEKRLCTVREASLIPAFLKSTPLSPAARTSVILAAAAILFVKRKSIMYPGTAPDSAFSEPLPPGKIGGCPFWGANLGSGENEAMSRLSARVDHPQVWKMFTFAKPLAVLSGSKAIKKILSKEFVSPGVSQLAQFGNSAKLLGTESMLSITDKEKYQYIRHLVGQSMTTHALQEAIPSLQKAAESSVYSIRYSPTVNMEAAFKNFTLDVAWRQIIGLDLHDSEVEAFHDAVSDWVQGISNFSALFLPFPSIVLRRPLKGRAYLKSVIERRIDHLEQNGPDGSTMSAMVFASDTETNRRLTREQIIDNALVLILAGSETSASTLTNAMLLLGLHPQVWEKVVAEQKALLSEHGSVLTKSHIDNDCPYLDSVVREVMRLIPISGGGMRVVDDTLVVDGKQIPKKWWLIFSLSLTHELDPKTRLDDGSHMDIKRGFKPERWMKEETRPTTEFMPFGAGVRFCLGHALATTEMKTFLAVLARNIEKFDLVGIGEKIKWKEGVISTPKNGVVIKPYASTSTTVDRLTLCSQVSDPCRVQIAF